MFYRSSLTQATAADLVAQQMQLHQFPEVWLGAQAAADVALENAGYDTTLPPYDQRLIVNTLREVLADYLQACYERACVVPVGQAS